MKRVVISGGANGIGRALVLGFAKEGYEVFTFDVVSTTFEEKNIHFERIDINNDRAIHNFFVTIANDCGPVHVLINNAAISKFNKPINRIRMEEFDDVISTNLRGAFLCSKEFISANFEAGFGRIINIASTRFHQNEKGWEAYGASKGGLVSLTNTMCVSLSNSKITVNCISPGWIECNDYDSLREIDHSQHPSGRVGKPSDIVNACLFLAKEESDFINGANLIIDGGMTKKMIYEE